ncbi:MULTISPECIES: ATP-binding protein [Paenibacillus]|uniref:histidine kinase n=1 Tax=Paenibacillus barengoltzii J12 TaxID=935846 RepID=A0ABY1M2E5_9BACL|nr:MULTISPECIES: ATP-binding protein [Paenibacillus]MEC2346491.1 ATP-binding protein [Paenibacillus barengoltzii]SMF26090.1 two-component system, sensor histidine kinase YcbA [Paenibacillus barengoltzii]SMF59920.1 two-component system, sensor histidine kinase YcbA [Paenibacillus barengoltzii J12]
MRSVIIKTFQRSAYVQIAVIAIGTALAGELKINPFVGDIFRIGLGSSAFLLFLLLLRQLPYLVTGVITGVVVLLFRTGLDQVLDNGLTVAESVTRHCSAAVYYIVFALGMSLIKRRLDRFYPLVLGAVTAVIDLMSNESELLTRLLVTGTATFKLNEWAFLMMIAMLRTYFVTGIYSSISVSRMRIMQQEQNRRIEQMLSFSSGLYGEVFYLKKSIGTLEELTLRSYEMYRRLSEEGLEEHKRYILGITEQIHEVKKDSQRILAGLIKLTDREVPGDMPLSNLVQYIIDSTRQYADYLGKQIVFTQKISLDYDTANYIPLLTLLGNLTANAVEAIQGRGQIHLEIREQAGSTLLTVSDSGSGFPQDERELVFEPGFTTKFDEEGVAATGIGLSHVRDIVTRFGGDISLGTAPGLGGAMVQIRIPTPSLQKSAAPA